MAANKFASMVNRNSHRLVLLLVYALLEWLLISLLLLNSLFGYLISKFASYFGLQKPCLWCSRIDHVLDKTNPSYADLLCGTHAAEISRLGRLAEDESFCSRCCDESLGREDSLLMDPYSVLSPSWGISEIARIAGDKRVSDKMLDLVMTVGNGYEVAEEEEDCLSSSSMFICYEKEAMECSKTGSLDDGSVRQLFQSDASIVQCRSKEDDPVEDLSRSVCDHRLIPVELIDLSTIADLEMATSGFGDPIGLVRNESEQVLTTEEVHALQINVKKAVMTKLIDIPGPECESDKQPDTPCSVMSERMERSENGDSASTMEQLRSALRAERKALVALYAELEEERSASAVAASETLAMITRLQEEKAAVQMEAVQYQRMMEEQSEYDQEALQLLNDLMVKREREKQELERELQGYRKSAPSSSSSWDDRHETVPDLDEMAAECERSVGILGELTEFDEERLSILAQLRALEERLENLGGDEDCDRNNIGGPRSMARKLLPFLDEAEEEESGEIAAGEEVDPRVRERLQALEAEREFLKNCVDSVKKGGEGMDLLHEILQHLKDLRSVELRMSATNGEDLGEEASVI